jgi:hypothetical protein
LIQISYPFKPKSNSKLEPGQFWSIKLENGEYACGLVLSVPPRENRDTKTVFVGLLSWHGKTKPTSEVLEGSNLEIIDQGEAHVKTITSFGESIEGKIELHKAKIVIANEVDSNYGPHSYVVNGFNVLGKSAPEDHEKLKKHRTWGYNFINLLANKYLITQT